MREAGDQSIFALLHLNEQCWLKVSAEKRLQMRNWATVFLGKFCLFTCRNEQIKLGKLFSANVVCAMDSQPENGSIHTQSCPERYIMHRDTVDVLILCLAYVRGDNLDHETGRPWTMPTRITPQRTEGFVGHKVGNTATGCAGTISFKIGDTRRLANNSVHNIFFRKHFWWLEAA